MLNLVEIGRNIAWLRELGDQSREDLALEAGMSISRLQELECGCENTTMETLRRIAEALNISPLTLEVLNYPDEEIVFMLRQRPPEMPEWRPGRIQLGSNIVFLRRLRGLTQRQLARMSRVSAARLRDIEHDCANATVEILGRIADALNLPPLALAALAMPEEKVLALVWEAREVKKPERV